VEDDLMESYQRLFGSDVGERNENVSDKFEIFKKTMVFAVKHIRLEIKEEIKSSLIEYFKEHSIEEEVAKGIQTSQKMGLKANYWKVINTFFSF
jgi:hypothetical protein